MSSLFQRSQPMVCKKLRSKLPQRKRHLWVLSSPLPSLSLNSSASAILSEPNWLDGKDTENNASMLRTQSCLSNRLLVGVGAAGLEAPEVTDTSESLTSWCESSHGAVKRQKTAFLDHLKATTNRDNEVSISIARSEVSSIQKHTRTKSHEFSSKLSQNFVQSAEEVRTYVGFKEENEVMSVMSAVEFCNETDAASSLAELQEEMTKQSDNRASESASSLRAPTRGSTIDQKAKSVNLKYDSYLICTEQLAYDDGLRYCSCDDESFSDLQSEIFLDSSDYEFSSSPSLSLDSGSQFSERSAEDSNPSHTFVLLLQFREQFLRSGTSCVPGNGTSTLIYADKITSLGFDVEEDAMSYLILRNRERRQVLIWSSSEERGASVIDQRSRMVHWMIQQSRSKKLQKETLFLAVSIFDRFMKAGSFPVSRKYQIAGVASLTLATRIEENQPYNSVREMTFCIGTNMYRRCEVVAMEWLMQEALNFQCSPPTVYNFLWFYLRAARADGQLSKKVNDLGELALLDHKLLSFWPSTIAAALVILACHEDAAAQQVIMTHVRTRDDDLPRCIESLQWLVKYIC
ncbi:hypothetical protein SAY87_022427 [Trapa incisa]|uniref:Cyclin-like domain-containing protein n=1 Tax=Trapa incisa TaxID=236973 RepID=A0AAN7K3S2_9MYRT|nr:hypothetical protein SAY87_022427 [Trapa incisa]